VKISLLTESPESIRSYVRESANRLATIAMHPLNRQTAHGSAASIATVYDSSKRIGARVFLPLLSSCHELCVAVEQNTLSDKQSHQANDLIKEAINSIQTALFTISLFGDMERNRVRIESITLKVQSFLKQSEFIYYVVPLSSSSPQDPSPPGAPPTEIEVPQLVPVEEKTDSRPKAKAPSKAAKKAAPTPSQIDASDGSPKSARAGSTINVTPTLPSERLLLAIGKLTQKACVIRELESERHELIQAARESFSIRFEELCQRISEDTSQKIGTSTPRFPIESHLVQAIQAQLQDWLKLQPLSTPGIQATARSIGMSVCIELYFPDQFILSRKSLDSPADTSAAPSTNLSAGVHREERYLTVDHALVYRKYFNQIFLPFTAREIRVGNRSFVISTEDIIENFDLNSVNAKNALPVSADFLPSLEGEIARAVPKTHPMRHSISTLALTWRNRTVLLDVESIAEPQIFVAKKVTLPGSGSRGIVGVAWKDDKSIETLPILDVVAWLDEIAFQQKEFLNPLDSSKPASFKIFRAGGNRYALAESLVLASGKLKDYHTRGPFLECNEEMHQLCDFRSIAGLKGESGHSFIVVACDKGTLALVVDEIEGTREITSSTSLRNSSETWVHGTVQDANGEITLIRADRLTSLRALSLVKQVA
jgi:hypothetical protein